MKRTMLLIIFACVTNIFAVGSYVPGPNENVWEEVNQLRIADDVAAFQIGTEWCVIKRNADDFTFKNHLATLLSAKNSSTKIYGWTDGTTYTNWGRTYKVITILGVQ